MSKVVMLGTDLDGRGGVASVVGIYRASGLFNRWPIDYLATHTSEGGRTKKLTRFLIALAKYLRMQIAGEVLLVHAHTSSGASFWRKAVFVVFAAAARIPVILHIHSGHFGDFYRHCGSVRRWIVRTVLEQSSVVVAVSHALGREVASLTSRRVLVIPNPVKAPSVGVAEERAAHTLLFLGQIRTEKGAWDLLEALKRLQQRFPGVRAIFGGDGQIEELASRAAALGIASAIDLVGWARGKQKDQLLAQCSVFVLPSYAEGLPMVILEALAAGAPVVATNVGGIPDAIENGRNGLLVEAGNIDELTVAIDRMLSDTRLRLDFSVAGRARVKQFAPERILAVLGDLYAQFGIARGTCTREM